MSTAGLPAQKDEGHDDGKARRSSIRRPRGPKLTLKRQRIGRALRRGYRARISTDEPGTAVLRLTVSGSNARRLRVTTARRVTVARGSKRLRKSGRATVVARFSKKARTRLRRSRRLKANVVLTVKDAAGNRSVRRRTVTLRR